MKLKDIFELIPGSQRVSVIGDEKTIYDGWELFNIYSQLEQKENHFEYLEYQVIRIETFQDKLQIRIVKD